MPRPLIILLASSIGAVLMALLYWGTSPDQPVSYAPQESAAASPSAAVPVDGAVVARYWSDNYSGSSWYAMAQPPQWDGQWLSVKTKLVADSDAERPAVAMCAALSSYWISSGAEFRPVRVLDNTGQVLVSRHSLEDSCSWRR